MQKTSFVTLFCAVLLTVSTTFRSIGIDIRESDWLTHRIVRRSIALNSEINWAFDRINQHSNDLDGKIDKVADGNLYIVGSGVLATHIEFGDRVLQGYSFDTSDSRFDCNGKGTGTASIAIGEHYGISRNANIIPVKVGCSDREYSLNFDSAARFIQNHISSHPGTRSAILLTFKPDSTTFRELKNIARNHLVIIPAGDENKNVCSEYSSLIDETGIMIVGSSTISDTQAVTSNYGSCVSIFGPGEKVTAAGITGDTAMITTSGTVYAAASVAGVAMNQLIQTKEASAIDTLTKLLVGHSTNGALALSKEAIAAGTPNKLVFDICPYYKLPEQGKCYVSQTKQLKETGSGKAKMKRVAKSVITFDYMAYNYYEDCFDVLVFASNATTSTVEAKHLRDENGIKDAVFIINTLNSVIRLESGPEVYVNERLIDLSRTYVSANQDKFKIIHEMKPVRSTRGRNMFVPVVTVLLPDEVTVTYDGKQEIRVSLGNTMKFYENTEGICGFYDRSEVTEFVDRSGNDMEFTFQSNKEDYVKEWKQKQYSCADCKDCSTCTEKSESECHEVAKKACNSIISASGCSSNCFEKLSPYQWYTNCVDAVIECCKCNVDVSECACTEQNKYWWATLLEPCPSCPPPCDPKCTRLETDKECIASPSKKMDFFYQESLEYQPKDNCHCNPEHNNNKCRIDGTWMPDIPPDCKTKTCTDPRYTEFTLISSPKKDTYYCGDKVEYKCTSTSCNCNCYIMEGDSTIECEGGEDKKSCAASWNKSPPVCTLKHCATPLKPKVDVIIKSDEELSWVSVTDTSCCSGQATFHCHKCYDLKGQENAQCCNNMWGDGSMSSCQIKECVDPNLEIKESGDPYLVVDIVDRYCSHDITYSCNNPCYELEGTATRKCTVQSVWSGELPKCVKKQCPILREFDDGKYQIAGGSALQQGEQLQCGDQVEVKCDDCYFACSTCTRTCTWNGTHTEWDNTQAQCQQRFCQERLIDHATIVHNKGNIRCGESSTAKCKSCYKQTSGNGLRKCVKNPLADKATCPEGDDTVSGIYGGDELVCQKMVCRSIEDDIKMSYPLAIKEKTCTTDMECDCLITFECPECYEMIGKKTIRCEGENWNGAVPTCKIRTCSAPNPDLSRYFTNEWSRGCQFNDKDGTTLVDYSETIYNCGDVLTVTPKDTKCVHVCDNANFTCQQNGDWKTSSGKHPTCKLVGCDEPELGVNVTLMTNVNDMDDRECADDIQYKCNKCHKLKSGDLQRTCQAVDVESKSDGEWSGAQPVCERITCQLDPPSVINGTVIVEDRSEDKCGEKIRYECNTCNRLVGNSVLHCEQTDLDQYFATWINTPPTCEPICCPVLSPTFSTDDDYKVIATHVRYLFGPIEMHVQKDQMSVTDNYEVCAENYVCQTIEAKCDVCFEYNEMEYAPVRECTKYMDNNQWYGKWKNAEQICTRKECQKRTINADMHIHYKESSMADNVKCNQTVELECDKCYKLSKESISDQHQCMPDKQWNKPLPTCRRITCDIPEDIEHGQWTKIQSSCSDMCDVIQYSCSSCYNLVGSSTLNCIQDPGKGTAHWDSQPPVCEPVCCPNLEQPVDPHTNLISTTLKYTKADISLHLTLDQMSNKAYFDTCQQNHVCQEIDPECGACFEYTEEDSRSVNGIPRPPIRKCEKHNDGGGIIGKWSNTKNCTIKTCPFRYTTDRHVHYTSPKDYRSTSQSKCLDEVTLTCDTCYELPGGTLSETHTCLNTKQWSKVVPTCQRKECPTPPQVAKCHYKDSTGNLCGESRHLTCDECYYHNTCTNMQQFKDALTVNCNNDKTWSWQVEEPIMKIRKCETPIEIAHGHMDFTGNDCGDLARYTCDKCYKFSHATSCMCEKRKCIPDPADCTRGVWNDTAPVCEIIKCVDLPPPPINGKLVGDANQQCGEGVKYECNEGFYLVDGDAERTCTEMGTWTGKHPVCEIKECTKIKQIPHMQPKESPHIYGSIITFKCDECYEFDPQFLDERVLKESTIYPRYYMLHCAADGNWNGSQPVCREKICGNPGVPANGRIIEEQSDLSFSCGGTVKFACNLGYKFTADSSHRISCDGKKWSDDVPTCVPVDCGPVTVTNSMYAENDYDTTYGYEVKFSCGKGIKKFCYEDPDPEESECLEDGEWSKIPTSCNRRKCQGPPISPQNGKLILLLNSLEVNDCGQSYQVVCNTGFKLTSGSPYVKCRYSRKKTKWSKIPQCAPKTCAIQNSPLNGAVSPNVNQQISDTRTVEYGRTITYKCNDCYRHVGVRTRTCVEKNGRVEWDADEPTCVEVECHIPAIDNGFLLYYNENSRPECGDTVTVSCNPGYKLHDGAVRTAKCMSDTNYDVQHFPSCDRVVCPDKIAIENGISEVSTPDSKNVMIPFTTVTYSCNEGYALDMSDNQSEMITCGSSGNWDYQPPTCKFKECPAVTKPVNGFAKKISESEVRIVCDDCYQHTDTDRSKLTCVNGRWDPPSPTECREVKCGNPGSPENGQIETDGGRMCDSVVTYSCDKGYKIHGNSRITCQSDGQWSAGIPTCIDETCDPLKPVANADVSASHNGKTMTYTCHEGYSLYGDGIRTCLMGSQWSGVTAKCKVKRCGDAGTIMFGSVSVVKQGLEDLSDSFGAKVRYSCKDDRYQLIGDDERECTENHVWSKSLPSCKCVSCKVLSILNGEIHMPNGNNVDSVIEYVCDDGYALVGSAKRTCQANGEWNGQDAVCKRVKCGKPRKPAGTRLLGNEVTLKSEYSYLEQIRFECEPSKNVLSYVCEKDGFWGGDHGKECSDL